MYGLIEIKNDLFDVARRLKSVQPFYKVYYNVLRRRYEVHDARTNTLSFAVPYPELDGRTVQYAKYTGVSRAKQLFADIEQHNAKLERDAALNNAEKMLEEMEKSL